MNIVGSLGPQLQSSGCRLLSSDQEVYAERVQEHYFPDLTIVCGAYELHENGRALKNPKVVFEVLSPSTMERDLTRKFDGYRRIPSLEHVVYVHPERREVIHYARADEGWLRLDLSEGTLVLGTWTLELDAIYALEGVPESSAT